MKSVQLQSVALNCTRYGSREDIIGLAERMAEIPGLTLARPGLVDSVGGRKRHVPFPGSPRELINGIYKIIEVRPEDKLINAYGPEAVNFWGIYAPTLQDGQQHIRPLEIYFTNTMHTRQYSEATATCTVSPDKGIRLEEVAQVFSRIARIFYDTLDPYLTWVSCPPTSFDRLAGEDVLALKLGELHWLNILGKPYVERLGRQVLLGAPAFLAESLEGEGIRIQLGREFTSAQSGPTPDEILKYFRPLGVRYLTWPSESRATSS